MTLSTFFSKLSNWFVVMLTTKTVTGPVLYFQRVYFLLTATSVIGIFSLTLGKKLRAQVERLHDQECVIKNTLGTFAVNAKNDSLTKSITSFEFKHQPWLATPERRGIFLDIGANIGFYSLLAIKKYGYQSALAFEPNPETYNRLRRNISLNALTDRISTFAVGLGDSSGTATLGTKAVHTGASSFILPSTRPDVVGVSVPTITFDELAKTNQIDLTAISFIKIDVEGYEFQVLGGMKETLPQLVVGTCLFIEIHPTAPSATETKALLEAASFTCIASTPQHNFLYKKQ